MYKKSVLRMYLHGPKQLVMPGTLSGSAVGALKPCVVIADVYPVFLLAVA